MPIFDADGEPLHSRGVVGKEPGLYFVGRNFLYAMSSTMVQGVSRDAAHVASTISARLRAATAKEGLKTRMLLVDRGCADAVLKPQQPSPVSRRRGHLTNLLMGAKEVRES